ncbi:hypothetical protein C4H11_04110 [Bacteroides zoogleoformans]|uniref:Uncharacterized protein n=1 Tax=Bacteroides zoogleoformans TaxID=28119 RepID=A0ABM6T6K5_9BACE|nr:hypothetical protein C4H11_04110 [Bacteroides zoogleoformans]
MYSFPAETKVRQMAGQKTKSVFFACRCAVLRCNSPPALIAGLPDCHFAVSASGKGGECFF